MKSRHRFALLATLLAVTSLPTAAQPSTPDASRVFPFEAPILGGKEGRVVYLPIPTQVLEQAAPDLADVRIHSSTGQELPYVVDSASRARATGQVETAFGQIVRTDRRIEHGDSLAPTYVERFELAVPELAGQLENGVWTSRPLTLSFEIHRERYVAQVRVLWANGRDEAMLSEGSIYRFPSPERQHDDLDMGFAPEPPSANTRLVVELRGEMGYLEPTLRVSTQLDRVDPRVLDVPLEPISSGSEAGVTTVRLARPAGVIPDRLRVHTTTSNFHRQITVAGAAQGQPTREVGRGLAYRLAEVNGAEVVTIEVQRTSGQALIVRIEDADSPPLEELTFSAEVTQPLLAFTAESGAMLRFGGGRVRAPVYDLMRVRSGLLGEDALGDTGLLAELGPITPNPGFDPGPALAFAFAPGRPVPLTDFTSRATVHVEGAREGLSRLDLSPALLAAAQESLADLRVVDDAGRQRSYLLGAEEPRTLALDAPGAAAAGDTSSYELALPAPLMHLSSLQLETAAALVGRSYSLYATLPNGRQSLLCQGFFSRTPDTLSPLRIDFGVTRVSALRLEITDGGDAPMVFTNASVTLEAAPVFLIAPDGDYTLYCGDEALDPPVYEVAQARALVLSLPAAAATVGEPEANPAHIAPAWYEGANGQTWLVWGVLLLALFVLVLLTLRVVRAAPEPADPGDAAPTTDEDYDGDGDDAEGHQDDAGGTNPTTSDGEDGQARPVE